jgi:hypothetical protein
MALRKKFTPAERALLTVGAQVQWLDGSNRKLAEVTGPIVTVDGYQEVPLRNLTAGRGISVGQVVIGSAGRIRV